MRMGRYIRIIWGKHGVSNWFQRIGVKLHPHEIEALANSISAKGYDRNVINYRYANRRKALKVHVSFNKIKKGFIMKYRLQQNFVSKI